MELESQIDAKGMSAFKRLFDQKSQEDNFKIVSTIVDKNAMSISTMVDKTSMWHTV